MMKKLPIYVISMLMSMALMGIIITQMFWVKNVQNSMQEQFQNRVRLALKGVLTRITDFKADSSNRFFCAPVCGLKHLDLLNHISPDSLNQLIKEELQNLNLPLDYEFMVFHDASKKILYGKYNSNHKHYLFNSKHTTSLSCLMLADAYYLNLFFPSEKSFLFNQILFGVILSGVFTLSIIVLFAFTISSLIKQKKLSAMKSDFVNNMTHELKTPIATISMASEMLLNETIQQQPGKVHQYAKIIYHENNRLRDHVNNVLETAVLEKGDYNFKNEEIYIHQLLNDVITQFSLIIAENSLILEKDFTANSDKLIGDKKHLYNVFSNLLDNAIKYTLKSGKIIVKTKNIDNSIVITFEDTGIGIASEHKRHIFKQFYRVPTGNIHKIKGFGLGLFYVKEVVEGHHGKIDVKSELGKGSLFEIILPLKH